MKDSFNREVKYLKLSVTDKTAYNFSYAIPSRPKEIEELLLPEEYLKIASACIAKGIEKIRIVGEPFEREDIFEILDSLSKLGAKLFLTTSSPKIGEYAKDLKRLGVYGVNINMDSLNGSRYESLTGGGDLNAMINAVMETRSQSFDVFKINTYFTKHFKDKEFSTFVDFASDLKAGLKLVELSDTEVSPTFYANNYAPLSRFITEKGLKRSEIFDSGANKAYTYKGVTIWTVCPDLDGFCQYCNQIKVTEDGMLYPCERSTMKFSLSPYLISVDLLQSAIETFVKRKIGGRL